jgi:hypothetical protein
MLETVFNRYAERDAIRIDIRSGCWLVDEIFFDKFIIEDMGVTIEELYMMWKFFMFRFIGDIVIDTTTTSDVKIVGSIVKFDTAFDKFFSIILFETEKFFFAINNMGKFYLEKDIFKDI